MSNELLLSQSSGVNPIYSNDVFSSYSYRGGASTTVINDIDLSSNGGMVMIIPRTANTGFSDQSKIFDTERFTNALSTDSTLYESSLSGAFIGFTTSGFTLGATGTALNVSGVTYHSYAFRKASKFFDVVNNFGTGTFSHNLGQMPGMIIFKSTNVAGNWIVGHTGYTGGLATGTFQGTLNTIDAGVNSGVGFSATAATFTIPSAFIAEGEPWVAYVFGHNTASDGLIRCGAFTTNASGVGTSSALGWEPQCILYKAANSESNWVMLDTTRGWDMSSSSMQFRVNLPSSETIADLGNPTSNGFTIPGLIANNSYIYMAIRMPNKPPTSGNEVFAASTGLVSSTVGGLNRFNGNNNPQDTFIMHGNRTTPTAPSWLFVDRLRGLLGNTVHGSGSPTLNSASSAAEVPRSSSPYIDNQSYSGGIYFFPNTNNLVYRLARKREVYDVVCFTGTGANMSITHNLGVAPELIIYKSRSAVGDWYVINNMNATTESKLTMNFTDGATTSSYGLSMHSTQPNASTLFLGGGYPAVNTSGVRCVARMFASKAGVSKVGSYIGNSTSLTIDCGFSAGARFILIKRTTGTGDWYVWDTTRGVVAGNDPHLSLNTSVAEVTTDDSIDPAASGFIVNQVAATNINVLNAGYLYVAIA
jgi:hypothetical protein